MRSICNTFYIPLISKTNCVDIRDTLTILNISVQDNKELLSEPTTVFESLESLLLENIEDDATVAPCEAMLDKHAHTLKHLHIYNLTININVPALPKIYHLSLNVYVENQAAIRAYEKAGFESNMTEMQLSLLEEKLQ